jgi:hypothetical protein
MTPRPALIDRRRSETDSMCSQDSTKGTFGKLGKMRRKGCMRKRSQGNESDTGSKCAEGSLKRARRWL